MRLDDFALRCGWPAKEAVVHARLGQLDLLVTCRRCGGSGRYEYNALDHTCYGCGGVGKRFPPLTARLAADVRERQERGELNGYYAQLKQDEPPAASPEWVEQLLKAANLK